MEIVSIIVRASWDPEARVWVATSEDVPGLVTEAETPDELARKLQIMIPELMQENGITAGAEAREIPLYIMAEFLCKVRLAGE